MIVYREKDMAGQAHEKSVLLTVRNGGISFGCMRAHHLDRRHAVLLLYEGVCTRYIDIVPCAGDLLVCRPIPASVFCPLRRVVREHLLYDGSDPWDVLWLKFPLFEALTCR